MVVKLLIVVLNTNSLKDLQGGDPTTDNYYHLQQSVYNNLTATNAQLANLWTTGTPTFQELLLNNTSYTAINVTYNGNSNIGFSAEFYNGTTTNSNIHLLNSNGTNNYIMEVGCAENGNMYIYDVYKSITAFQYNDGYLGLMGNYSTSYNVTVTGSLGVIQSVGSSNDVYYSGMQINLVSGSTTLVQTNNAYINDNSAALNGWSGSQFIQSAYIRGSGSSTGIYNYEFAYNGGSGTYAGDFYIRSQQPNNQPIIYYSQANNNVGIATASLRSGYSITLGGSTAVNDNLDIFIPVSNTGTLYSGFQITFQNGSTTEAQTNNAYAYGGSGVNGYSGPLFIQSAYVQGSGSASGIFNYQWVTNGGSGAYSGDIYLMQQSPNLETVFYYSQANNSVGIGTSTLQSGYDVTLGGLTYIDGNTTISGTSTTSGAVIITIPPTTSGGNYNTWLALNGSSGSTIYSQILMYEVSNASWFPISEPIQTAINFYGDRQSNSYNLNITYDSASNFYIQNQASSISYPLFSNAAGNVGINTYQPNTSYSITLGGSTYVDGNIALNNNIIPQGSNNLTYTSTSSAIGIASASGTGVDISALSGDGLTYYVAAQTIYPYTRTSVTSTTWAVGTGITTPTSAVLEMQLSYNGSTVAYMYGTTIMVNTTSIAPTLATSNTVAGFCLSEDGTMLVIQTIVSAAANQQFFTYELQSGTWKLMSTVTFHDASSAASSATILRPSLSANKQYLIVCNPYDTANTDQVSFELYTNAGFGNWTFDRVIVPSGQTASTTGSSLLSSISHDGTTIALSAQNNNSGAGAVWLYNNSGTLLYGPLTPNLGGSNGVSLALSRYGNILIIGCGSITATSTGFAVYINGALNASFTNSGTTSFGYGIGFCENAYTIMTPYTTYTSGTAGTTIAVNQYQSLYGDNPLSISYNTVSNSITCNNLEGDAVLISDYSGRIQQSLITQNELMSLSGVTSNIQTQINAINGSSGPVVNSYGAQLWNTTGQTNGVVQIGQPQPTTTGAIENWIRMLGTSDGTITGTLDSLLEFYLINDATWFPITASSQVVVNFRASQSNGYNINVTHDSNGNFFIQNAGSSTSYPLFSNAAGNVGINTYQPNTSYSNTIAGTTHIPNGLSVPSLFPNSSASGVVMCSIFVGEFLGLNSSGVPNFNSLRNENFNLSGASAYNNILCIPYSNSYTNLPSVSITVSQYNSYSFNAYSSLVTSVSSSTTNFGYGTSSVLIWAYTTGTTTAVDWSSITNDPGFSITVIG